MLALLDPLHLLLCLFFLYSEQEAFPLLILLCRGISLFQQAQSNNIPHHYPATLSAPRSKSEVWIIGDEKA